jgi:hypothetical protein
MCGRVVGRTPIAVERCMLPFSTATPVEGCCCVKDEERRKQTHPVPTIFRGRRGRGVSIPAPWTENDQMELDALYNATIKMAEIDEVGADDGQSPPPSLTPV